MATLIRCVNGHMYDADKTKDCPFCEKREEARKQIQKTLPVYSSSSWGESELNEDKTVAAPVAGEICFGGMGKIETGLSGIAADNDVVTVGICSKYMGNAYVTGWLVGIDGPVKGRDFRIIHGNNRVGHSYNADITIAEGTGIAELAHCTVVYDGKGNHFFIGPGTGTITYLNGNLLNDWKQLKIGDRIKIGNCLFEFVPFCREGHVWEA